MYQNSHRSLHMASCSARLLVASLFPLPGEVEPSWSSSNQAANTERQPTTTLIHGELSAKQTPQQLVSMLRNHNVDVGETHKSIVVTLPPTTLFEFTAVELTNAARVQIRDIAAALNSYKAERQVSIIGFPSGVDAPQCNRAFNSQGTEKVALALEAAGVSRRQRRAEQEWSPTPGSVPCCPVQDSN